MAAIDPCFIGSTKVQVDNNCFKEIQDLRANEIILQDKNSNRYGQIIRVTKYHIPTLEVCRIPKGILGNTEDIICTKKHKFVINGNLRSACRISGVKFIKLENEYVYNIQFKDMNTFYVDNLQVESLHPNNKSFSYEREIVSNTTNNDLSVTLSKELIQNISRTKEVEI